MRTKLTIVTVLLALFVLFVVQNIAIVEITFLFWSIAIPRSLLMVIMLLIGTITGWILHGQFEIKKKK